MKRITALLLCVIMVMSFASCGKEEKTVSTQTALPALINELGNDYSCIDDMPDWEGEKLELTVWYGYGSNEVYIGKKAKDDKFRKELERVTGVTLSEKSFDNGGQTGDTKIAKMVATDSWPDIGIGIEASILDDLIKADKLYDISEYVPKYMTNYMDAINSSEEIKSQYNRRIKSPNGKYSYTGFSNYAFKYYDKDYTPEKYSNLIQPQDSRSYIWVRDDILTTLYPEAKTQAEIKEIYLKNGKFEEKDLKDVTINSPEEFRTLLEKIKALGVTEEGREVSPFYTHSGQDNWDLLTMFGPALFGKGIPDVVSCFNYFDGEDDEMKNTMEQKWFKDMLKFFNGLVIDGLASDEALIDNRASFDQKKANGEYAIFYGNVVPPTDEQLKAAGKDYSYRRVMIDVPCDYTKYPRWDKTGNCFAGYGISFFNTRLSEAQLEQVMRFLDFFYTEAGMKFANWGPKKAGLYEEDKDGNMKYTDERFASAMLNDFETEVLVDYGMYSFPRIDYFIKPDGINKYQPELIYAKYETERIEADWKKQWNYGFFEPLPEFPTVDHTWYVWSFTKYSENVKRFWNARSAIEEAIKTVFTATNDKEFESLYKSMLKVAENNGYNDSTIKEMTNILKEQNGNELFKELAEWKAE